MRRLHRLVAVTRAIMVAERLWPRLWPLAGLTGLFLILSWTGLWLILPPVWRMVGVAAFAVAAFLLALPLLKPFWPTRSEALSRLDQNQPHRVASAFDDTLALGSHDPTAQSLWLWHQRKLEQALSHLRLPRPTSTLPERDPYALRAACLVGVVASLFVGAGEHRERLASAFDWDAPRLTQNAVIRIDGWIDPPPYTRLPPLMLDFTKAQTDSIRVPENSILVIRSTSSSSQVQVNGGLQPVQVDQPSTSGPLQEQRFAVKGDAVVQAGHALKLVVIKDHAPSVAFSGEQQWNVRGSLTLSYRMKDDYGFALAEGVVSRNGTKQRRTLVPPPRIPLNTPSDLSGDTDTKTTVDLSSHPWAGALVDLVLVVRDEAGQEGVSDTRSFTLPQRSFENPLAKALVEQRRRLILDPDDRAKPQKSLDALLIAPDRFTPSTGVYLSLRWASNSLRKAKTDADLLEVADLLWDMALQIEEGDLSQAEKELRSAQQALRQALERGAGQEEIARLTQELRQAMDRYLKEFAQRPPGQRSQEARGEPPVMITPDDLDALVKRMEERAKQGDTAEAQRLLEQLQTILENLRQAPSGQANSQMREMNEALNSLDEMTRDQQKLQDDTHRGAQGQDDQPPPQTRPERRTRNNQKQGPQDLAGRQQTLRERLNDMQQKLRSLGAGNERMDQSLQSAEQAMREAEGALGSGAPEEAVEAQGRALEGLRQGAEGLAREMAEASGNNSGNEQQGNRGDGRQQTGGRRDEDPLGRPTRSKDFGESRVRVPQAIDATARARQILEELRRRLSDPARPRQELDYLERLLRRN